jgi:hypothetical protein
LVAVLLFFVYQKPKSNNTTVKKQRTII